MKQMIAVGSLLLVVTMAGWVTSELQGDKGDSEVTVVAQSNEACSEESMSEEEAEDAALLYASDDRFEEAVVVESELLTYDELVDQHSLAPAYSATCYWYVKMSGTKIIERGESRITPTPTPGPKNTFISMEVVLDSETAYLATKQYATTPIESPVTLTPGPTATLMSPPTVRAVPPTPTFFSQ